ncbi:MAG: hydrolase 1, exosortase A system-associated [Aliiglaciecola sp.]|uniref:hydrolase 1, exosortase A system-associated n=1 Tax=Aliiglaciecola sp. M165 TaxID=2593649 RepID=UPI0011811685|nr:hydrolase 1, exosortase A system-associated [Aliiglaciecola sp. M165]TRY30834.1 hydrolase 1, exosortase A system-associated [Aliiglaciecola sp. M165]
MLEQAITFDCENAQLLGILHGVEVPSKVAVLLVVGGPQYRVGSHRQFIQLSRYLAQQGIPSLRFDYTGMGDSSGDKKSFESIDEDILAATNTLIEKTKAEKVVIWGLCDAASAAMMYVPSDDRVAGLVLLNPWLRSDAAMGKTMLKYYYLQRLTSAEFWKKLFSGKVKVAESVGDAKGFVKDSVASEQTSQQSYQSRMQKGLAQFSGEICLILSGVDLTAKEFEEQTLGKKSWRVLQSKNAQLHKIEQADHTFSTKKYKQEVETITANFVKQLASRG